MILFNVFQLASLIPVGSGRGCCLGTARRGASLLCAAAGQALTIYRALSWRMTLPWPFDGGGWLLLTPPWPSWVTHLCIFVPPAQTAWSTRVPSVGAEAPSWPPLFQAFFHLRHLHSRLLEVLSGRKREQLVYAIFPGGKSPSFLSMFSF